MNVRMSPAILLFTLAFCSGCGKEETAGPVRAAGAGANAETNRAAEPAGAAYAPPVFDWSTRKPRAGRTFVFSRNHTKYTLHSNYLKQNHHTRWLDRHLFYDRSIYKGEFQPDGEYDSVVREAEVARDLYLLDGFRRDKVEIAKGLATYLSLDHAGFKNFHVVPEVCFNPRGVREKGWDHDFFLAQADNLKECLSYAAASPLGWEIDGKLILTSYHAEQLPPDVLEKYIARIREKVGDKILFVSDCSGTRMRTMTEYFENNDKLTAATFEELKAETRRYLDASDGIMYAAAHHIYRPDRHFYDTYYRDVVVRALTDVLAEEKYAGKLLGLSAGIGYVNNHSGSLKKPAGTQYFRKAFEIAMLARPDFIVLPEWHELNENNYIQPTVYKSLAIQRILRYYMHKIRGEKPTPNPGDDTSIPNLCISFRKIVRLGEEITFEVLNIPDGEIPGEVRFELRLYDENRKPVKTFPEDTLRLDTLADRRYSVASEEFPNVNALVPELTVTAADGRKTVFAAGLPYVQIRPTWNFNYIDVNMPLRDLLRPDRAEITFAPAGDKISVTGDFAAGDEIAYCEVCEDEEEVFAVDPKDEYAVPENGLLVRLGWSSPKDQNVRGAIAVTGGTLLRAGNIDRKYTSRIEIRDNRIDIREASNTNEKGVYLVIADTPETTIRLDRPMFGEEVELKVSDIRKHLRISRALPNNTALRAEHMTRQPDIPFPLGKKSFTFKTVLTPVHPNSMHHVRLITKSGKIYRSRPYIRPAGTDTVALPVYSETRAKTVSVPVAATRIPVLEYVFAPDAGTSVKTPHGLGFYGMLGGGFDYGLPFTRGDRTVKKAVYAPEWHVEDGRPILKFDGNGQYCWMPKEALPVGAFTLEFEIKLLADRAQTLVCHHSQHPGPLAVFFEKGRIVGEFSTYHTGKYANTVRLEPGVGLPVGQWARVKIRHDLDAMHFEVDGVQGKPCRIGLPGDKFADVVFGGPAMKKNKVKYEFMNGALRAIKITHR